MNRNKLRTSGRKLIASMMKLTIIAVISAACVASSVRAAMAVSSAYGPPSAATGATPPGGYSAVVTSQTITPAGGTIGPVSVGGVSATLIIPAGAFPVSVQITLTAPNITLVGSAGTAGYRAVAGVGVQVQENGSPYPGTFLKPLTVTIRSSSITTSSVVMVWNGKAFVTDTASTITTGVATVSFDTDPDFAALSPSVVSAAIPGATRAVTGKPFIGEGILAGVLVLLGASGLGVGWRRRVRAGTPR